MNAVRCWRFFSPSSATRSRAFFVSLLWVACGCGVDSTIGSEEPFAILGGQFFDGILPRTDKDDAEDLPVVTSPIASTLALRERLSGVTFSGTASSTAQSVAFQFEGLGSGYWLIPTGARDPQDPNILAYSFTADLQAALPAGQQTLLAVAFDAEGRPGPETKTNLCIRSLRPDNGNACFPQIAPPALVVSIEWSRAVDLDIALVAPDERIVNSKQPSLPGEDPSSPPLARLVLDANADCHLDARQREDIVFDNLPPSGSYQVYVSLARTCGESQVSYEASFTARTSEAGGNYGVRTKPLGGGMLTATQVNPNGSLGTYVAKVAVQ